MPVQNCAFENKIVEIEAKKVRFFYETEITWPSLESDVHNNRLQNKKETLLKKVFNVIRVFISS